MAPTVVVLTGPVGSGKTTSMRALWELLDHKGEPAAMVDMDSLRALCPDDPADPFHASLGVANLQAIWPQLADRGARWLLLTDAVEHPAQRTAYENAVPDATVIIVRLDVPINRVHQQLRRREVGGSLDWHLKRSVELRTMMINRGVGDVVVPIDGQEPPEIAGMILEAVQRHLGSAPATPV